MADLLSDGLCFYFRRQTGSQEVTERVTEAIARVVQGIREGKVQELPQLLPFVRLVARDVVSELLIRARFRDTDCGPEVIRCLKKVLEAMPEREREILRRFYLVGRKPEEIRAEMDLTEEEYGMIRSKARRASTG